MKNILILIEILLGMVTIGIILMQETKSDALSGLIQGGQSESFYNKNKMRTKENILVLSTWICIALFFINTLIINLI